MSHSIFIPACWIVGLLGLGVQEIAYCDSKKMHPDLSSCGPQVIEKILHNYGIHDENDRSQNMSDHKDGLSLLNVRNTLSDLGLKGLLVKARFEDLLQMKGAAILFVDNGHFLAVLGKHSNRLIVFDPPNSLYLIDSQSLLARWAGQALIIDKALPSTIDSHGILLSESKIDAGLIKPHESVASSFTVFNASKNSYVLSAQASCGCIVTGGKDKIVLKPGASSDVSFTLRGIGPLGDFEETIAMVSIRDGSTETQIRTIKVIGMRVDGSKLTPSVVNFGLLDRPRTRNIFIATLNANSSTSRSVSVTSVSEQSVDVEAKIFGSVLMLTAKQLQTPEITTGTKSRNFNLVSGNVEIETQMGVTSEKFTVPFVARVD